MMISRLTPDAKVKVLRIHHEVFGGATACKQCPGNCCKHCSMTHGYRDFGEPLEVTEARKKKYGFDKVKGFKGEHGCKLPVTERSSVCLAFACSGTNLFYKNNVSFYPPFGVNKPFTQEQHKRLLQMDELFYQNENIAQRYAGAFEE